MAVMVDDDPESSSNQPGIFGIEIEATRSISAPTTTKTSTGIIQAS